MISETWHGACSGAMSTGGRIGFEAVEWFNGGLFDDDTTLPLDKAEIKTNAQGGGARLVGG